MTNFKDFDPVPTQANSTWKTKALIATRGNQTFTGMVLIAVLGRAASNPPRITSAGIITEDGAVMAFYQSRLQPDSSGPQVLCTIGELIDRFRYLADHLKLSDPERTDMFNELKMWISEDHRPKKDWDQSRLQQG